MPNQTYGDLGMSDIGVRAKNTASQAAEAVADQAERVGSTVRQGIEHAGEQVRGYVDHTVQYFRDHDAKMVVNDVTSYVKAHPTQALIGAAILGFVAGRLLRRE